jgi:predicted ATPase
MISALRCTPKYSLDPEKMAVPCQVQPFTQLASDGSGLTSCLENLRELAPERFRELEAALKLFVDSVEAVTFPAVALGQKAVLFHEKPTGYKIPASEASDGLLLFLGYLTIAYVHGDASVMLIEEPETGVHPHRLKAIVELLRAISRGALGGRPVQVIATSHSPALLDCCGKEEIIVFQRDKQGDVHATPLAQVKDVDDLLKDFRPGELINTMGEGICESPS